MKFNNYQEVLTYLYENLPMFQRQGAAAFRKDLSKTIKLDEYFGHPHKAYKTIHVAGTNGKGSTTHMLAAICQQAGYKTGLYTSPHLKDFTERIRINGKQMVPEAVVAFLNNHFNIIQEIKPSFFEITSAMAFQYFKDEAVDIAIIETGMGGRLDSTNIIDPELSIITNVSYDHQQFLGETLQEIAGEKAGIIKQETPVVISEFQEEISHIFSEKVKEKNAPVTFAKDIVALEKRVGGLYHVSIKGEVWPELLNLPLLGDYQITNLAGVLAAYHLINNEGILELPQEAVYEGLKNVKKLTGLKGRYQVVREKPKVICDVGHNEAGLKLLVDQLSKENYKNLYIVFGVVNDKDLTKLWGILPKNAYYFFTQANIPRAMAVGELTEKALAQGFKGETVNNIPEAYEKALSFANENDLIFVGGSTFTVAEIKDIYDEE
ncbi:MAG: bifunctional folylpolyglutamate synthase/dihydrofolate synthase [Candidatus Cyclobacteriaceae bacterium M2_1C_046]